MPASQARFELGLLPRLVLAGALSTLTHFPKFLNQCNEFFVTFLRALSPLLSFGMLFPLVTVLAFVTSGLSHGDHDQTPISGPHKSLWYNTLPGDGGTQVRRVAQLHWISIDQIPGRFCLLWHFYLRTFALPPLLSQR